MTRQLNYLNSVLKRPDSNVYQAWAENNYGQWVSPLKKLWSEIKSKSFTYGEFNPERVKEAVRRLENISIYRELEQCKSLQFMTSHAIKPRGPYIRRSRFQDILKAFRVGDWRLGIKELGNQETLSECPFGCKSTFDVPHFMFWCPQLNDTRKQTGLLDFHSTYKVNGYEDKDIVRRYLWALNDDPLVVKEHGSALIRMRNNWFRKAEELKVNLNVKTKNLEYM